MTEIRNRGNGTCDIGSVTHRFKDLHIAGSIQDDGGTFANPSDISVLNISGSSYTNMQDVGNIFHSSGYISGGNITDNGNGSISIGAGEGVLRSGDSITAPCYFIKWSGNESVTLVDREINYIHINWNGGNPAVVVLNNMTSQNDSFLLASVYRNDTTLHITDQSKQLVANHINKINIRDKALNWISREQDDGAIVTQTGVRNIAVTQGRFWIGLNNYTTP